VEGQFWPSIFLFRSWICDPPQAAEFCMPRIKQHRDEIRSMTPIDPVYTRREAAKILRISIRTLQNLEKSGAIQSVRITPRIIGFREAELRRYLHDHTVHRRPCG
jgi:predicted DNA-binding transcriptional regulator AlpA